VAVYQPNGAPAAYALSERAEVDKIPLITLGYGRTEATDGTVFPYNFPVMLTFYSEASSLINYIAQREGGFDKLKGKKIATVYHDSAYGRETLGPLKLLAEKYGFENIQIPVADPGNEQSAQWRQIRQPTRTGCSCAPGACRPRWRSRPPRVSASRWTTSSATSGPVPAKTCCPPALPPRATWR
jgi:ABC-type branched-subunit amino acid transport system substrate-binding protein